MAEIIKFISKDIGDLDKLLGVDKANLSKILGTDVPASTPDYYDYYSESEDGWVRNRNADFSTARDALTGDAYGDTDDYYEDAISVFNAGGYYNFYRSFLYFDLSSAPAGVTSVELHLKALLIDWQEYQSVYVQEGTQAASLSTADYDAFTGNPLGDFNVDNDVVNPTIVNMPMNGTGLAYIQGVIGGMAKLCLREYDHDFIDDDSWLGTGGDYGLYFSEAASEGDRPFLRLRYDAAEPSWHSYYTWNTYWEAGHVDCWDPTVPSIGAYSGCTGNYIDVKGTWAGGLRPTKFRIIHDGPDDAPNGLRNITLYDDAWGVLGIYNTATGYNSGTDIPITWGTKDLFRIKIESYENGDGWNSIAVTDYQFYF